MATARGSEYQCYLQMFTMQTGNHRLTTCSPPVRKWISIDSLSHGGAVRPVRIGFLLYYIQVEFAMSALHIVDIVSF